MVAARAALFGQMDAEPLQCEVIEPEAPLRISAQRVDRRPGQPDCLKPGDNLRCRASQLRLGRFVEIGERPAGRRSSSTCGGRNWGPPASAAGVPSVQGEQCPHLPLMREFGSSDIFFAEGLTSDSTASLFGQANRMTRTQFWYTNTCQNFSLCYNLSFLI